MSAKANHFKLGVFVLGGFAVLLAALLLLGVGQRLRQPLLVETYLDQSVQGLDIGSKVNYRGVHFGIVHDISFSRTRYEEGKEARDQRRYILIDVAVDDAVHAPIGREAFLRFLEAEVERGLRFRLNAQGITGLSYLELDYVDPQRYPRLPVHWTPENFYIPSAPGTLTRLLAAIEQVFQKLEAVDVGQVLTNLNRLLATTESEIKAARLGAISDQAHQLLTEVRASNQALRRLLEDPRWQDLPGSVAGTIEDVRDKIRRLDLDGVVQRLDRTLATAEAFLAGKEPELAATLANLRALSENLRALSELARAHPAGLLLGQPPPPVQPKP